ncbi:hypothetical protein GCM10023185_03010 [Hymenobacter saemangeumensis]|uniref:Uncharacterized protein n=1 Tax=Hymenobacter saemangeumensis TaxID=1084522 RepID=A0ABP8HZ00_9BACT
MPSLAQDSTPVQVPANAITQLEDFMEVTKQAVATKAKPGKNIHVEARPEVNRQLIIAADEFRRVTRETPSREAYLECIDKGLARVASLTSNAVERQQVADFFQELVEIVGLKSSDGRLAAFVANGTVKQ